MADTGDVKNLRLDPSSVGEAGPLQPQCTPQILGQFLRGPVPIAWLAAAGECGLNALRVGLAIWHVSGKSKWARTVPLTTVDVGRLGVIDRQAKRLALRRLKRAGLISTKQIGLNAAEVTVLRAYGEKPGE